MSEEKTERKNQRYLHNEELTIVYLEGGKEKFNLTELNDETLKFVTHYGFKQLLVDKCAGMACKTTSQFERVMKEKFEALKRGEVRAKKVKMTLGEQLVKKAENQLEAGEITEAELNIVREIAKRL